MCPRSIGTFIALVSLVAVAVAAGFASPAVVADESPDARSVQPDGASTQTPDPTATREPAATTMRLQVQSDGDVRWRVSATYEFRDDADAAAFGDLAAAFEAGEVSFALDSLGLARRNASKATGREMTFRNVERTASRNDTAGEGMLTLAVTWTNFARVEGNRLYVGDAFNTTDGTWLPRLTERQTLVVEPPEGYSVVSAPQVGIVDGTARWEGPRRLDGREPWIVYSGEGPATTTTTPSPTPTPTPTTLSPTPAQPGNGGLSSLVSVALLVLVAGAVLVIYAALHGLEAFMDVAYPMVRDGIIRPIGYVLGFVALLGLYPKAVDRSPKLARAGAVFAVLGAVGWFVTGFESLAEHAGADPPAWLGAFGLLILLGFVLGYLRQRRQPSCRQFVPNHRHHAVDADSRRGRESRDRGYRVHLAGRTLRRQQWIRRGPPGHRIVAPD
jgi:hypothetical protein